MALILLTFNGKVVDHKGADMLSAIVAETMTPLAVTEPTQKSDVTETGDVFFLFVTRAHRRRLSITIGDIRTNLATHLPETVTSVHQPRHLKVFDGVVSGDRPSRVIRVRMA